MTTEQITAVAYLIQILDSHEVLTRDSNPDQIRQHPYAELITDLLVWKDRW
jgi:hypothetical protein